MASQYSAAPPLVTTLARLKSRCPVTSTTCISNIVSARILHSVRLQDVLGKRLVAYCPKIPSPALRQTTGDILTSKAALPGRLCPVVNPHLSEQRFICSGLTMPDACFQSHKRKYFSTYSSPLRQESPKRSRSDGTTTTTVSTAMANCNLNAAPVGAAIFDEPVSYLDLKAWIAEQEALPQPEPLTDIQKKAILDLKKSIVKTKQSFHLDHADWVSLLMRYRDAHAAEGCTVEFNDNHQNQVGKVGFMCFVSLSVTRDWEPILFPSKENGILVDDATGAPYVPHFTKKKDAKRYAAKCAIEWLMYQRYMPSDCQNVTFKAKSKPGNPQNGQSKQPPGVPVVVPLVITPQTTPTASVNTNGIVNGNGAVSAPVSIPSTPSSPANGESDSNDGSDGASLDPDAVSNSANSLAPYLAKPPPAPRRRKGTDNILDIDVHDDSISVHQRLAEMAKRLGMQVPHIIVEPIPDAQNMFRGQANFPIEAGQVPEHVGRVDSGFMGPATKEMVAEKVLEYLFEVERVRIAEFDSIIADEESH